MSEFASEETVATDEVETPVEAEPSVDDAPSSGASNDEDWED